jgi:Lipocalin-like domain
MLAEKIVGVWELQIWETVVDGNVVGYPLGEKASGFIAYHPTGFMSVNISAPNRVRLATDDPFAGDPKLLALDAQGYLSYCGPFSVVSENEVIHHLKLCSFENWVRTDKHRHAQFDLTNDTLTLSTAPVLTQGRMGSNRRTWKRVSSMLVRP